MRNIGHPRIGPWHIDVGANELVGEAESVRLPPKSMAVLAHLVSCEGQTVSRDALMDRAGLSDEGLSRVVAELRRALGDDARSPRYIKTIPRSGYRLVASTDPGPADHRRWLPWAAAVALSMGMAAWWAIRPLLDEPEVAEPRPMDSRPMEPGPTGLERTLSGFPEAAVAPILQDPWIYFRRMTTPPSIWRVHRESLHTEPVDPDPQISFHLPATGDHAGIQVRRTPGQCSIARAGQPDSVIARCRPGGGPGPVARRADGLLVFEREPAPGERHGLASLHPDTGARFRLTEAPVGQWDAGPRISPDGRRVAFSRGDDTIRELFVIELEPERSARALSADRQKVFGLDWTGDRCLVVATDRTGRRQLWEWSLDGSPLRELGGADAFGVIAVPGGLIYEHPIFRADIFRLTDEGAMPLVRSDRYDNHPRFSPSGRSLAFVSNRDGYAGLWVADGDGSNQRRLFRPEQARVTRPYWIDDDHLLAVVFHDQVSEVVRVELGTGRAETLIGQDHAPRQAVGLSDESVVFVSDRGIARWYRGEVTPLSDRAVDQVEVGSDRLIVKIPGEDPLFVIGAEGGLERLDLPHEGRVSAFSASGPFLVWSDDAGTRLIDLRDRRILSRHEPVSSAIGLTLDIDPRDRSVVMSTTVDRRIDLIELRTGFVCR